MTASVEENDADLVARTLRGEDAAFGKLMARHKAWAHRFIRRYVGNQDDAYDVLQDTFFAAWLALRRYQQDRPFDFWLRRIALNKCRDRARREAVRRAIGGILGGDETPDIPDGAPGPEALAESGQSLRRLESALQTLPRQLKEPLLLSALEGLSHREAGELLGINAKAVEMRIYRARSRLAALYDPDQRRAAPRIDRR